MVWLRRCAGLVGQVGQVGQVWLGCIFLIVFTRQLVATQLGCRVTQSARPIGSIPISAMQFLLQQQPTKPGIICCIECVAITNHTHIWQSAKPVKFNQTCQALR
jgi:hypothetical protein